MTIDTSDSAFIDAFDKVAAEAGRDFVYEQGEGGACLYVKDGDADCIIGRTLAELGMPLDELKKYDPDTEDVLTDKNGIDTVNPSARELLRHLGFSNRIAKAGSVAQEAQDRGLTWGYASDNFHRMALQY